jgi:hypothetical protein
VRYWLADLADEISAGEKDGTLPPILELDRVWITGEGRAKLLDFPAPGVGSPAPAKAAVPQASAAGAAPPLLAKTNAAGFLGRIAVAALEGQPETAGKVPSDATVRLPLHARDFLKSLPQLSGAEAIALALSPLLQRAAVVSRWRRAALVAGCIAFPMLASLGIVFGFTMMQQWNKRNPGLVDLFMLLQQRSSMRFWGAKVPVPTDSQFAIHIAGHYRSVITNRASWSSPFSLMLIKGEARHFAEQSVAEPGVPTDSQLADADAVVKRIMPKPDTFDLQQHPTFPLLVASVSLAIYVGLPALVAALLFRGGLVLRLVGVIFVRRDGARASRWRVFWRAVVTWSPLAFALVFAAVCSMTQAVWAGWLAAGLVGALACLSLALPERGVADRLAGTWPVLR